MRPPKGAREALQRIKVGFKRKIGDRVRGVPQLVGGPLQQEPPPTVTGCLAGALAKEALKIEAAVVGRLGQHRTIGRFGQRVVDQFGQRIEPRVESFMLRHTDMIAERNEIGLTRIALSAHCTS